MTEEEWATLTSSGTIVETVRRHLRLNHRGAGRKSRLAACAILNLVAPQLENNVLNAAIDLTERFADGVGRLADIDAVIDKSGEALIDVRQGPRCLTKADPWYSAYGATVVARELFERHESWTREADTEIELSAAKLLRDIFGNPFRPVSFDPDWCTSTAVSLAKSMYESRDFAAMPILSDALQDAGCEHADILDHCRGSGPHVRGCWVVDLVLGKA